MVSLVESFFVMPIIWIHRKKIKKEIFILTYLDI